MTKTTITTLPDPHGFSPDPLTDLLRSGARGLIQQAVEAELSVSAGGLFRRPDRGWSRSAGAPRASAGTRGDDRDRRGAGQGAARARPGRHRRESPVHLDNPAALFAQSQIHRRTAALALSQRYFHWRLSRSTCRTSWARMQRGCHRPQFLGLKPIGGTSMTAGNAAISARAGSSTSGRTVSTSALEWLRKNNAFWC